MVKIESCRNVMINGKRYKRRIKNIYQNAPSFASPPTPFDSRMKYIDIVDHLINDICVGNYYRNGHTCYFADKRDAVMVALSL